MKIFLSQLSGDQLVTLVAGLVAGLVTGFAAIIAAFITKARKRAKVELVDVTINDKKVSYAKLPVVDVSVRNTGDMTAVLTQAVIEVHEVWHLELQFPTMLSLKSSETYDIKIDPQRDSPYIQRTAIAHSVKSDEADRFSLSFGLEPMLAFESVYHVTLTIIFNGKERTNSKELILVLPDMSDSDTPYFMDEFSAAWESHQATKWFDPETKKTVDSIFDESRAKKIDQKNRKALLRAAAINGIVSNRAAKLIDKAKSAREPYKTRIHG